MEFSLFLTKSAPTSHRDFSPIYERQAFVQTDHRLDMKLLLYRLPKTSNWESYEDKRDNQNSP